MPGKRSLAESSCAALEVERRLEAYDVVKPSMNIRCHLREAHGGTPGRTG